MKNCDEMVNSLLKRRDQYAAEQKRKKKVLIRTVTSICCMCLVVLLGFGIWQNGVFHAPPPAANQKDQQTKNNENLFVVNKVDSVSMADMDVQFSHYNHLSAIELESVHKNFESAIGMSYETFTAKIPITFVNTSFYSVDVPAGATTVDTPADVTEKKYIPHDYAFKYQTENKGEATIAVCSDGEPLRDCIFRCDNPEQSRINGVTVTIYGYEDFFMMQFSYENVNYDIETNNITLEELEELLTGIMRG